MCCVGGRGDDGKLIFSGTESCCVVGRWGEGRNVMIEETRLDVT